MVDYLHLTAGEQQVMDDYNRELWNTNSKLDDATKAVRLLIPWAERAWDADQEFMTADEVAEYKSAIAAARRVLNREIDK